MISGDSVEYDKLARWTDQLNVMSTDFILTAEIGVREGYGSHVICENIKAPHVHIGIDPYGDIDYKHVDKKKGLVEYWVDEKGERMIASDGSFKRPTYPNTMKDNFLKSFRHHTKTVLFQLEDTEYMNAFGGGVPIYFNGKKKICNTYDLVFFDGPHTTDAVMREAMWFANRSRKGTRFIFDDIDTYEMSTIAFALTFNGFKTQEMGDTKCMLERTE
jgi:hypothetical protein|tara:strand:- start:1188 stop:1838 length:651 start_codon:yes stop_codon:yes gene_type:complete